MSNVIKMPTKEDEGEDLIATCPDCGEKYPLEVQECCECGCEVFNVLLDPHRGELACICASCHNQVISFTLLGREVDMDEEEDLEEMEPEGSC